MHIQCTHMLFCTHVYCTCVVVGGAWMNQIHTTHIQYLGAKEQRRTLQAETSRLRTSLYRTRRSVRSEDRSVRQSRTLHCNVEFGRVSSGMDPTSQARLGTETSTYQMLPWAPSLMSLMASARGSVISPLPSAAAASSDSQCCLLCVSLKA